jgi:DNA-binding HxlR family transcriptional regulator
MKHSTFPLQACSVARSLEVVGEWWTLLIVREAFFGTEHFSDFKVNLGIAKNMLSDRLGKLVQAGLLDRVLVGGRGNPVAYRLTEQGRDLLPMLVALMQWGDRWINRNSAPVRLLERETGEEIARMAVSTRMQQALSMRDLVVVPGPGADDAIKRRFGRRAVKR